MAPRRTMKEWLVQVSDSQSASIDPAALQRCRDMAERSRQMFTTSLQTACVAQRATETLYRGKRAATKSSAAKQEEASTELELLENRRASYEANWNDAASLRLVMQRNQLEDAQDRLDNDDTADGDVDPTKDVEGLLEQLRVEPTDAAEAAAKFLLYESFASSVTELRVSMEETARSAESLLPAAPLAAVRKDLKSLDQAAHNGVEDVDPRHRSAGPPVWIVHQMVRAITANLTLMQRMSKSWATKIQLCAESAQTSCPICLDDFSSTVAKETLSCCHAVCTECWATWSEIQQKSGLTVFCPLCKQEQFTHRLLEVRAQNAW